MKRDETAASVTHVPSVGKSSSRPAIWMTLADTTWRVAVPTVLLAGIGIAADKRFGTVPLWTLVGLALGLVAAGALVWNQLQIVTKTEDTK